MLPMQPGMCERRTHDYRRPGTTTLFAALEIATGRVTGHCLPRDRHQEFLRSLRQITRAYPAVELHLVMDKYAAHKHPAVRAWLAAKTMGATRRSTCAASAHVHTAERAPQLDEGASPTCPITSAWRCGSRAWRPTGRCS
jgi:hypothetical protein